MTKDSKIITPKQFIEELRRYQKGSVTRRHFLGVTGLGLATAFRVMQQHGGWIEVQSRPGTGTRLELYFPGSPAAAKP